MMEASETSGNAEEDWKVYQMLCKEIEMDTSDVDVTTSLRSEVAALQFKRDRLAEELNDMKCQMRTRDQRCLDLQTEADQLREQSARQNAIISSLKKRICEMEERERNLYAAQGRNEISVQSIQRDCRYHEDRAKELEKKLRVVELDLNSEEQKKDNARMTLQDLIRRLSISLGCEVCDGSSSETLIHKANELMQELSRLRSRSCTTNDALAAAEIELRSCKDNFERILGEKECLERQSAGHLLEIDRLRESKETLEMQLRVLERELSEMKEKLASSTRSLGSASGNIAQQESIICQLKDELKQKEDKCQRLQHENRHVLESLSILLSSPARFVESLENSIKDRIREILTENKDKSAQIETLREKLAQDSQTLTRQLTLSDQANNRIRILEEERNLYETRLNKAETEISTCELSREGLKRDKNTFMSFLERLGRILNMEEISNDVGVDLHTESLLLRAEQLSRLESDKLVDKTSLVYQLQRRVRTLREQVQRKDLHLDLLRRKLSLQEDSAKTKCLMQSERDEANLRIKKLVKQVDRLQLQLSDTKSQVRDLNAQLAEAADYKITALERGRKIEELQKRLIESETLRTKYNRKVTLLKDQVRTTGETIEQERNISDHSLHLLRDELGRIKDNLCEISRREAQLQNFKGSVAKILGAALPIPDYELITRLQKLVDAHHDYTLVSRRYDDPVLRLTARSPTGGSRCTRTPDRSRYDDSGYTDAADIIDDIDDDLFKTRQTRPCI
ncbi:PREDICTED: coiled-coil domain-containing protein 170 isoform X2 [Nicrophorus vespilloides]|uniref:Coiled-coil domain-containing protein 170 isoform X2 n=1 Tax=Nicrophorus vespilloides TaxID=110193 RepID=A0ABM1N8I2_NICVS|nr:PREDICTED: coiled-coil domain-containing protein 170 isoform X2 [Nicrophorus vespilloides]